MAHIFYIKDLKVQRLQDNDHLRTHGRFFCFGDVRIVGKFVVDSKGRLCICQMSCDQSPCWLGYIGDDQTTHLYRYM